MAKKINYKDYYTNLSPLETRLFEEGYWEVGFVNTEAKAYGKIIKSTEKWNFLMNKVFKKYGLERTITQEMIIECMREIKDDRKKIRDNYGLKRGKRVVRRRLKDGTVKEYVYYD